MISGIYRIIGCGDLLQVPSQKSEGGFITKRFIRIQEFGGWNGNDPADRLSNSIIATMIGSLAQAPFTQGDLVEVSLRFSIREYQGNWYQDVTVNDIHKL